MEQFQIIQPSKLLRPYVKQYWFLVIDNAERGSQRYVPSGCTMLAFHRGDNQLAYDWGYCDKSHLIKYFRTFIGYTPKEYLSICDPYSEYLSLFNSIFINGERETKNNWDCFDEIARYLKPEQYFFGFPFMVDGGRDADEIHCVISGMKYSHTPIGEMNGVRTLRVLKIVQALEEAHLKPVLSRQILLWIITHYATAAGLTAGILSAGNAAKFVSDSTIIRTTIRAIREGFSICLKRGYDAQAEKANKLYQLPLFISVPIAKKIYSNEPLQLMFDGHVNHSPEEVRQMIEDMIAYGINYGIVTPNVIKLKNMI